MWECIVGFYTETQCAVWQFASLSICLNVGQHLAVCRCVFVT